MEEASLIVAKEFLDHLAYVKSTYIFTDLAIHTWLDSNHKSG